MLAKCQQALNSTAFVMPPLTTSSENERRWVLNLDSPHKMFPFKLRVAANCGSSVVVFLGTQHPDELLGCLFISCNGWLD
jgi:hypothetical protein